MSYSYSIKNNKLYKSGSSQAIGEVKNDRIYKSGSSQAIGEVKNDRIYKSGSSQAIGEVKKIRNEIKDSMSINGAHLVGLYHFFIKPIF
jgi:hypothetical protein